ncbi:MAG: YlbG family protein [Lentilactobacillus diolivorans]|nr:YlbG family protein [Lentilactobacillus diolivorans]RRG01766.1 MAG: DUF2129 domain-containing protein [Lactobacillus sp.]
MAFEIQPTEGLIVYLHSLKHSRNLRSFGRLYYVSKRMRYALLYVNLTQEDEVIKKLTAQNYVKQVVPSHLNELLSKVADNDSNGQDDDDRFDEDFEN